jgi:CRISPR-associated protein Csm5
VFKQIEVAVRTLTPLHIGTGRKLVRDFDFVTRSGRTYRLREERLAEGLYARDPRLTEQLLRTPPGQLLKPEDLAPGSSFVRYSLPGEPQGQEFREGIKDVLDRPYLPGSSLKGALRTVLAWQGWKEVRPGLSSSLGQKQAKFAAFPLEKAIFGRDPHHDLLRALRVVDSAPAAVSNLAIEVVQVWTKRGPAAPISVEAVRPGTVFALQITLDEALFSDWSAREEGFPLPHREWLDNLTRFATDRATERLRRETSLWDSWGRPEGTNPCSQVLAKLVSLKRGSATPAFPLQLGFGTGWEGTTIGAPLKDDPNWENVFEKFKLGRVPGKRGIQVSPEAYPTSRRVAVAAGVPGQLVPLGWVWVEWKEAT